MKKIPLLAVMGMLLLACNSQSAAEREQETKAGTAAADSSRTVKGAEFANWKYAELGRSHLAAFARADVDGWLVAFDDKAVFLWNNGDSLSGKDAIAAYWRNRWAKLDSIRFSNEIWLPIRVTQPQSVEQPGVWLLGWYQFDAAYKGNIKVRQWAHDDIHFNANDKIDRLIHYVDMGPIRRAFEGQSR